MTPTIIPLHLCFKGARNYLQGADLYQALVEALARERQAIGRVQMKMRRFFRNQPDMHWLEDGSAAVPPECAVVEFAVEVSGRHTGGWLMETQRKVSGRTAFEEEGISRCCSISERTVSIQGAVTFLPIEIAVSMTKLLHNRVVPASSGRWVLTRLDLQRPLRPDDGSHLAITLNENLHNRLTRSSIVAAGAPIGSIYFSLVAG